MKYFEELNLKQKIIIVIIPLIMIITIISYIVVHGNNKSEESNYDYLEIEENNELEISELDDSIEKHIIVYVSGEVNNVGLVDLIEGERISDAIEKAGGLKDSADISEVNMAYQMQDGEKLFIPSKANKEETEKESNSKEGTYITKDNGEGIVSSNPNKSSNANKKININTASKEELMKISGIGESTANKIISYRENKKFNTIEELKNIPGIGDSKFESFKNEITI